MLIHEQVRADEAQAAIDLLATAGARTIRTIGVDGGTEYDKAFADLNGTSRLSNGQRHFDRQFESFPRVIRRTGVDLAPLGVEAPMRVFIAASPSERLPAGVLANTIRRHAMATLAALACAASYACSGHQGIYRAQRLEAPKHRPA